MGLLRSTAAHRIREIPLRYFACMANVSAGLCDSCVHQRIVTNTRGSRFSLCERSRTDPNYPRYPRLPVLKCAGHEPRREDEQQVRS
jgi:hypothetical protein